MSFNPQWASMGQMDDKICDVSVENNNLKIPFSIWLYNLLFIYIYSIPLLSRIHSNLYLLQTKAKKKLKKPQKRQHFLWCWPVIRNYPSCKFNSDNEQKACMMLNDWTIKWKMRLNADASKLCTQRKTALILHTHTDAPNHVRKYNRLIVHSPLKCFF